MSTRITVPSVQGRKVRRGDVPLVMVTAYDAPGARMADAAGIDMILVGDSCAMVVHGHPNTLFRPNRRWRRCSHIKKVSESRCTASKAPANTSH